MIKINGVNHSAILLCGVTGLVKVYGVQGYDKPWLCIKNKFFTVNDELNKHVLNYINLRHFPVDKQNEVRIEFLKVCRWYI